MLRHQVGVLAQAVAGSLDLDDDSMVEQPIEQRGGNYRIVEDLKPRTAMSKAAKLWRGVASAGARRKKSDDTT